ncbi:hypothetical protein H696_02586 [Fonticula alba]|uniref:EGF-like domain-containing protein n=1 Tax=Fonticula alba TaxID=691883 RepID=A0A058Z810_FONAL|nr:hypothetical protein H696_02586 [Fonticula alba]KCV70256.1 hypothetical protein H696_02586 [Fonticula alba]|eukprot:XP_009494772.1 hypothetical protein H696_02586 [Fonticula alba]
MFAKPTSSGRGMVRALSLPLAALFVLLCSAAALPVPKAHTAGRLILKRPGAQEAIEVAGIVYRPGTTEIQAVGTGGQARFDPPTAGDCGPGCQTCVLVTAPLDSALGTQASLSGDRLFTQTAVCTVCEAGLFRDAKASACVAQCPDGFFASAELGQCLPCWHGCATCSGREPGHCTGCPAGQFLVSNRCVDACPETTFPRGTICDACDDARCAEDPEMRAGCPAECPAPAADEANTIGTAAAAAAAITTTTYTGLCDTTCMTCSGPTADDCLTCFTSLRWHIDRCVTNCPLGYWDRISDYTCQPCAPNCTRCTGPAANQCTACTEGRIVVPNPGSTLVGHCDVCAENCSECASSTVCQRCKPGFRFIDGRCYPSCEPGFYEYTGPNTDSTPHCIRCHESCKNCTGPTPDDCTSCNWGFRFWDGICQYGGCTGENEHMHLTGHCGNCVPQWYYCPELDPPPLMATYPHEVPIIPICDGPICWHPDGIARPNPYWPPGSGNGLSINSAKPRSDGSAAGQPPAKTLTYTMTDFAQVADPPADQAHTAGSPASGIHTTSPFAGPRSIEIQMEDANGLLYTPDVVAAKAVTALLGSAAGASSASSNDGGISISAIRTDSGVNPDDCFWMCWGLYGFGGILDGNAAPGAQQVADTTPKLSAKQMLSSMAAASARGTPTSGGQVNAFGWFTDPDDSVLACAEFCVPMPERCLTMLFPPLNLCYHCNLGCAEGHSTCKRSVGPNADQCRECPAGRLIQETWVPGQGECVTTCASTHFQVDNMCRRCAPQCLTCEDRANNCTACKPGFLTMPDGACRTHCPEGYRQAAGNKCLKCGPHALKCDQYGVLACEIGYAPRAGECVPTTCPSGFFWSIANRICRPCHESCNTCRGLNADQCITCSASHPYMIDGLCQSGCPAGWFWREENQRCEKCVFCAECFINRFKCCKCVPGEYLFYERCYINYDSHDSTAISNPLDPSPKMDLCDETCASCSTSAKMCTSCHPGWRLVSGTGRCVLGDCPEGLVPGVDLSGQDVCRLPEENFCRLDAGFYRDPENYECRACPEGCGMCHQADVGLPVVCLACAPGTYAHPVHGADKCQPCHKTCGTCNGPGPKGCLTPSKA